MQGGSSTSSTNLELIQIQQLLPHIEKFILELGNNLIKLEEKLVFVENNSNQLKKNLGEEHQKTKKLEEAVNDLKMENKCLK